MLVLASWDTSIILIVISPAFARATPNELLSFTVKVFLTHCSYEKMPNLTNIWGTWNSTTPFSPFRSVNVEGTLISHCRLGKHCEEKSPIVARNLNWHRFFWKAIWQYTSQILKYIFPLIQKFNMQKLILRNHQTNGQRWIKQNGYCSVYL